LRVPETIDIQSLRAARWVANSLVHKLLAAPGRWLQRVSSKHFDGKLVNLTVRNLLGVSQ
jgi:hypothetical protein